MTVNELAMGKGNQSLATRPLIGVEKKQQKPDPL